MTNETTFREFVQARFGGVLSSGGHEDEYETSPDDCPACVLEALNACHDRPWSDSPEVARTFDIRPLNDAPWSSDAVRTEQMIRLVAAVEGSLDWPKELQQRFVERLAIRTVNVIVAELPYISPEVADQCRNATTLQAAARWAARAAAARAARAAAAEAADSVLIKAVDLWVEAAEYSKS